MRWKWDKPIIVGLLIALPIVTSEEAASQPAQSDRVNISYEAPKDRAHDWLHKTLVEKRALEKAREFFLPFKLPRPLLLKVAPCDGEVNAWYENDSITLCYEYLQFIHETATSKRRPSWASEEGAIMGPLLDVLLHEGAHAIFHMLKIPVLGREEDAADQVAAYTLLKLYPDRAQELIAGIVYSYLAEDGTPPRWRKLNRINIRLFRPSALADVHSTPLQRMYNVLCFAYGSDPKRYKDLVLKGALPNERAEGCEEEYELMGFAYRTLIAPHLDADVVRRFLRK